MPNYLYQATDADAKWLSGEIQAAGLEEAEARLRERGLRVETLSEAESIPEGRSAPSGRRELVEMVEHLASLTSSGLPLPSGLRAAGLEVTSARLRRTFDDIADLVESGGRLDEALARSGRKFPPDLQGVIAAGAGSGRLAEMLGEYVRAANLGTELRRMIALRLAYPAFALAFVVGLVIFLCSLSTIAVDSLVGTMSNFGVEQTSAVKGLSGVVRFFNDHALEIVLAAVSVPLLALLFFRFAFGPAKRRQILCAIPVVGPVFRYISLNGFCHLLAILLEAETPLPRAFELAGSSVRDAEVAEACAKMGRAVEEGESLTSAMRLWPSIPAGLGQLLRWSEDRRSLPGALHLAGDMFESLARSQSRYASNVLATFLLLFLLWWIGFAIIALYLPLFDMIRLLGRLA